MTTIASATGLALEVCSCHSIVSFYRGQRLEKHYACPAHTQEIEAAKREAFPPFGEHLKVCRQCETLFEAKRRMEELHVSFPGEAYSTVVRLKPLSNGKILLMASYADSAD